MVSLFYFYGFINIGLMMSPLVATTMFPNLEKTLVLLIYIEANGSV